MEAMAKTLMYGCATHNGNVRKHNEDAYEANPELGLWIVADGMGGHDNGEVASAIVTKTITELVEQGKELPIAVQYAHKAIIQSGKDGKGIPAWGLQSLQCKFKVVIMKLHGWVIVEPIFGMEKRYNRLLRIIPTYRCCWMMDLSLPKKH